MEHKKLKEGNLVQYHGRLNNYSTKAGKILSIDKTHDNRESFVLKVKEWNGKELEIRAYDYEIWPLTVDVKHLEALGFIKENDVNVFHLEGLTLIRPIFITHEPDGSIYNDRGFVIVEKPLNRNFTEVDIDNKTTSVSSMHALQNYIEGKIVKQIDWDIFL